jgi:hypothetical protein
MADNLWLCSHVIAQEARDSPCIRPRIAGSSGRGKNPEIFLTITYLVGRAMAKNWPLKAGL